MKIVYATKNIDLTAKIEAYTEKKLGKLAKFVADDTQTNVVLRREKGGRDIVEITIYLPGVVLRAEETTDDLFASIDACAEKLIRQIRRHRTRLEKRLRSRGDTSEEQIVKRLGRSQWEMEQGKKYDHYVVNDQVETCAEEILKIIANAN